MTVVELRRRLLMVLVVVLLLFASGALGYLLLEGWSLTEALFMTVITLSTVGFSEVRPLSDAGRIFTMLLILSGVVILALSANVVVEYFLSPDRGEQLRRRRQMSKIGKLQDHVIIVGAGRVGTSAALALEELQCPFLVVERDPVAVARVRERGWLLLEEDATRDETLLGAGCERARGLLVCTGDDSDNLFMVLSARALNPDIFIVVRSVDAANEAKMRRVGANKIISPYQAGGRQMANIVLRPQVAEFMEVVTAGSHVELFLEEIKIQAGSLLVGKTVIELDIRKRTGAVLVSVLRLKSERILPPDENTLLEVGDDLIAAGTREQLARLEALVIGSESA